MLVTMALHALSCMDCMGGTGELLLLLLREECQRTAWSYACPVAFRFQPDGATAVDIDLGWLQMQDLRVPAPNTSLAEASLAQSASTLSPEVGFQAASRGSLGSSHVATRSRSVTKLSRKERRAARRAARARHAAAFGYTVLGARVVGRPPQASDRFVRVRARTSRPLPGATVRVPSPQVRGWLTKPRVRCSNCAVAASPGECV